MDKVKAIKVLKPLVDSYVDYANISMKEEDDDIVDALEMAIEALKCSETPKSSERTSETAQADHTADIGKKVSIPCAHENDVISRQMAIDTIMGQPPEPHYPSWYAAQIEKLPAVQPDHNADSDKKVSISCGHENDLISRAAAISHVDDVSYIKEHPNVGLLWKAWIESLPSAQPATNCSEIPNGSDDTISRQAAIEALARMMPRSYTPDGSHPADEEIYKAQEIYVDCIESIEILPAVQPEIIRCKDCKHRHVESMVWTCPFGLPGGENFFCGYGTEPYKGE